MTGGREEPGEKAGTGAMCIHKPEKKLGSTDVARRGRERILCGRNLGRRQCQDQNTPSTRRRNRVLHAGYPRQSTWIAGASFDKTQPLRLCACVRVGTIDMAPFFCRGWRWCVFAVSVVHDEYYVRRTARARSSSRYSRHNQPTRRRIVCWRRVRV